MAGTGPGGRVRKTVARKTGLTGVQRASQALATAKAKAGATFTARQGAVLEKLEAEVTTARRRAQAGLAKVRRTKPKKTVSGLARNAAASNASRRARRRGK